MNTDENYERQAVWRAQRAYHFTYGDGGNVSIGAALAAEAQVYATLALVDAVRALSAEPKPPPQPLGGFAAIEHAEAIEHFERCAACHQLAAEDGGAR